MAIRFVNICIATAMLLGVVGCRSTGSRPAEEADMVTPERAETGAVSVNARSADEAVNGDTAPQSSMSPQNQMTVLKPGLTLQVSVFVAGDKEIFETRRIAENGFITLPLLGRLMVQGMIIDELEKDLEHQYAQNYFVNPTIDVSFVLDGERGTAAPWGFVTVLGRVKSPGRINIPATQDMTVTMSIQQAGGFDSSAKQTAVRITRQAEEGRVKTIKVNLEKVGAKGEHGNDIVLFSGDVVYVPESIF